MEANPPPTPSRVESDAAMLYGVPTAWGDLRTMDKELAQHELEGWFTTLHRRAEQLAQACLAEIESIHVLDGDSIVRLLVSSRHVSPAIGCTSPFWLPTGTDRYASWQRSLWGRRCKYYTGTLTLGLQAATPRTFDHNPTTFTESETLESETLERSFTDNITATLCSSFLPPTGGPVEVATSLDNRGDIANFQVTYLDPTLFSALFWSLNESLSNNDLLWQIIETELLSHTDNLTRVTKDNTADESTVWWALSALLAKKQNEFHLKADLAYEGHEGFTTLTKKLLLQHDVTKPVAPSNQRSLGEATAEIHDSTKTRLWLVKNWTDILRTWNRNGWNDSHTIRKQLLPLILQHLTILYEQDQQRRTIAAHMYLTGLALEVLVGLKPLMTDLFSDE
jgi:hypothetical protein